MWFGIRNGEYRTHTLSCESMLLTNASSERPREKLFRVRAPFLGYHEMTCQTPFYILWTSNKMKLILVNMSLMLRPVVLALLDFRLYAF